MFSSISKFPLPQVAFQSPLVKCLLWWQIIMVQKPQGLRADTSDTSKIPGPNFFPVQL